MKRIALIAVFTMLMMENQYSQEITNLDWSKIVLRNYAVFKNRGDLNWGSAFLIKYNDGLIACTARDFTGTLYTHGKMLLIKDFDKELIWWKLYLINDPTKFIMLDSLVLKKRIEKKFLIYTYSRPFLTFSLKNTDSNIIPLIPNVNRIKNNDSLLLIGYDNTNKIRIIRGKVANSMNEKYAGLDIRIQTEEYLDFEGFVGSPIIDNEGKVVGVFNRAYSLKIDKNGNIIDDNKVVENSHYEYFVEAASMRDILGKDYSSKMKTNDIKTNPR